jgi:hypothetical protein
VAYVANPARSKGNAVQASSANPGAAGWIERAAAAVDRHWRWALGVMMLVDVALLLYMGRGLTFFYDDWDFVTHDYGGGLHSLLVAHVGNISIFPVAVYKVLFHLVGLNHYAVYRLVVILLHLAAATLVFVLAARRQPRAQALLATALVLFLGAAWEDLLWAFQVGYLLSIVGGLAAWVLLEREDRLGDAGAFAALLVSVGSSSLGIAILVGVVVELAWRRQWRRGWLVLIPAVLYLLWYSRYGESEATSQSVIAAPGFAADLGAAAFGALAGRALEWGRPLALLGALGVALRLVRIRAVSPRLAGLLATAIALWSLTAVARSTISSPEASRYVYLGAVVIVLLGVECLAGVVASPRALLVGAAAVLAAAVTGLTALHNGSVYLRGISQYVAAELGALQLASAHAPPGYQPDPQRAPQILAGSYLHTVHAIGSSPADSPAQIAAEGGPVAAAADGVLVALDGPTVTPWKSLAGFASTRPPTRASMTGGSSSVDGACLRLLPAPHATLAVTLLLPGDDVSFSNEGAAPVEIAVARLGPAFVPLSTPVPPRSVAVLAFLPDAAQQPWRAQLSSPASLTVCGVASRK